MEAKLKAKELLVKFTKVVPDDFGGMDKELAQKCSLIAVDEILKLTPVNGKLALMNYSYINFKYWEEVKQEINKL